MRSHLSISPVKTYQQHQVNLLALSITQSTGFVLMAISIQYNLTGVGWSECIVEIDNQKAYLTASYLSDALTGLLEAVTTVVKGTDEATAFFTEEPGEYRWRLTRVSQERLYVRILWFDESFSDHPDGNGRLILETQCRLRTFAGAVLSSSQRVLKTHGLEGYREKWVKHEFPVRLQAKLQQSLSR